MRAVAVLLLFVVLAFSGCIQLEDGSATTTEPVTTSNAPSWTPPASPASEADVSKNEEPTTTPDRAEDPASEQTDPNDSENETQESQGPEQGPGDPEDEQQPTQDGQTQGSEDTQDQGDSSSDSTGGSSGGSTGGSSGGSNTGSNAPPPPMPEISDLTVEVSGPLVWINYTLVQGDDSWVTVSAPDPQRVDAPTGEGRRSISYDADYGQAFDVQVDATLDGRTTRSQVLSGTTDAWPYSWATDDIIAQPGSGIALGDSGCTLGFILTSPDNRTLYAVTAGHCGDAYPGLEVQTSSGTPLGTVKHARNDYFSDHALIEIRPEIRNRISPAVVHWTGPTGLPGDDQVTQNSTLCFFGQSPDIRWGSNHESCGKVDGFLDYESAGQTSQQVLFKAEVNGGDSGAPIIDYETGNAIGILARIEVQSTNAQGTSICTILDQLGREGYPLRLATWDYQPPPAHEPPAHVANSPPSIDADSYAMTGCASDFDTV